MATIDDVWNYLQTTDSDRIGLKVAAIEGALSSTLISTPAWKIDQLYRALSADTGMIWQIWNETSNPDNSASVRNAVGTTLNLMYDLLGSYLSSDPEFDHPENLVRLIWDAVHREWGTPDA